MPFSLIFMQFYWNYRTDQDHWFYLSWSFASEEDFESWRLYRLSLSETY